MSREYDYTWDRWARGAREAFVTHCRQYVSGVRTIPVARVENHLRPGSYLTV